MSVLNYPRLYLNGWISWNPPTGNNNDYINTFLAERADINYLVVQPTFAPADGVGAFIPGQYIQDFRIWMTSLQTQPATAQNPNPSQFVPGEWNYFGDNGAAFVNYTNGSGVPFLSQVTGGVTGYNQPAAATDPVLAQPAQITGNTFGASNAGSPARLVDNNTMSTWTSQVFLNQLLIGDQTCGLTATAGSRMFTQMINYSKMTNVASAGVMGIMMQTSFPADGVSFSGTGSSSLLAALSSGMTNASGLMLRLKIFNTLYYQNGVMNDYPTITGGYPQLSAYYQDALNNGIQFFNPAHSQFVATLGLWNQGETMTAPQGRLFVVQTSGQTADKTATATLTKNDPLPRKSAEPVKQGGPETTVQNLETSSFNAFPGPAVAQVVTDPLTGDSVLSIDLASTMPMLPGQVPPAPPPATTQDSGTLTVSAQGTTIGTITFGPGTASYGDAAFYANSGIVDLPLSTQQLAAVQANPLSITSDNGLQSLSEAPVQIVTDQRSIYLEQGGIQTITLTALQLGVPAANVQIAVAQYQVQTFNAFLAVAGQEIVAFGSGSQSIVSANLGTATNTYPGDPVTSVLGNPASSTAPVATTAVPAPLSNITILTTGADGTATLTIAPVQPGFVTLTYVPLGASTSFNPPTSFGNSYYYPGGSGPPADFSFVAFSNVRVMGFDDALPAAFAALWNNGYNQTLAWQFVYQQILFVYDALYPTMLRYVPLGNAQAMAGAANQLLLLTSADYAESSTLYMPVTRDMSAGKRAVLQMWCKLALNDFPPQPIAAPI
ncbi:hypothetical protein [Telmatospirillum siberiense]|uniref:Uncharacterized protein n=1 Tax=Telmatospirillum siberiense TaxID=382514 RepID=A0A2N3PZS0_9PROT|nr:hypothetical protein [Telmatospirillum siberiense]PKU25902.1 hypothetical protein CWS72_04960 [Telmatospirillum siberiense]